jgi:7-keto-8-aminopelargonate synthetase-like enzyme
MYDAVIEEIDGRPIRIGDQWLLDYASCNYLGFDLDPEIMDSIRPMIRQRGDAPELVADSLGRRCVMRSPGMQDRGRMVGSIRSRV